MNTNERRMHTRARVIYGASASSGTSENRRPCIVKNFSDAGAMVEFSGFMRQPSDDISLTIERKHSSYRARVVWWRENLAGLAFSADAPSLVPADHDIEQQLRKSEKKARRLQRQVREALGQD